jgi:hypothetical protein
MLALINVQSEVIMGVIHKLRPEVKEFILEKKRLEPGLSCRTIAALVFDKYKIKLSKSSANSLFKQAGLSMPIGRRPNPQLKEAPFEKTDVLARCVKAGLLDGSTFYLDGRLHTVWHSAQIPEDFSAPVPNIKGYIENVLKKDHPWVLFFASGYASPTQELFEFILSFLSPEKRIARFTLYNNKLEELEKLDIGDYGKRHFVFGVWPWQFKEYIKVNTTSGFSPFHFAPGKREFYIAEAEAELLPPEKDKGKALKLRGVALKTGPDKNVCLNILSNFTAKEIDLNELVTLYLNRWPDLEGALRDFSAKIEQFRKNPAGLQKALSSAI